MGLLKDEDKQQLIKLFEQHLTSPVKMLVFTKKEKCEFCQTTVDLLEDLVPLHDNITLEKFDFEENSAEVEKFGLYAAPAIVLLGEGDKDFGIRFFGVPAGYEFTTLVEDILDVSAKKTHLSQEILDTIAKVGQPVHMKVLISPSCPHCPKAVRAAHQFAIVNENIRGDMIEVAEFPEIGEKYNVQGVPATFINEKHNVVGGVSEDQMAYEVLVALGLAEPLPVQDHDHDHDHEH